ncbi:hypothetical protein DQ384_11530 [Sphaerisporangium album]|uniref:Uncharacterized protein n=1 Tax=Sphaerisporangium album TaxID=509200 RepID=A0A367FLR0_9ACTN|nr:hypothetical protein DQ384_11530 [Sphaerisporangium album]
MVIFEDTWVQGGHAQSAAATVLMSGAAEVTIVTIARRVRNNQRSPGEEALRNALPTSEYTLDICPVTGRSCP